MSSGRRNDAAVLMHETNGKGQSAAQIEALDEAHEAALDWDMAIVFAIIGVVAFLVSIAI